MRRIGVYVGEGLGRKSLGESSSVMMYTAQMACLRPAFEAEGLDLVEVWWREADADWSGLDAALALSAWDYQDHAEAFLASLSARKHDGLPVFNAPDLIAWNLRKTYLRDLERIGVPVIPTLWPETPTAADVRAAWEAFGGDVVVLKRQVGAGARGQQRLKRGETLADGPLLDRAGMIQPFLKAVADEGEYSFLYVDGALSHVVQKRAQPGDYRIQPRYGGRSSAVQPSAEDAAAASRVLEGLARLEIGPAPLYARVDMARGESGGLLLMELELIEPYLFVEEGPAIGAALARALKQQVNAK